MLYEKRRRFDKAGALLGKHFSKIPLTPNQWTFLAIIFAVGAAFYLAKNNFLTAALFFAIASVIDAIDGAVARYRKMATPKGGYFDTVTDRYVEFIVIAGLFFVPAHSIIFDYRLWLFLYLFGSVMTTYAKAAAKEYLQKDVRGGVLERGERLILLFFGILSASVNVIYLAYIIIISAALANITALQRIKKAMKK